MNDVMIDIETLDTRASAVILSVGAVRFDMNKPGEVGQKIHLHLNVDDQLDLGRTVSASTMMWWLDQSDAARSRITAPKRIAFTEGLSTLASFVRENDRLWGNGAGFDNVILADAYRSAGMPLPWRYWNDMCYRTLKNMHRSVKKPVTDGVKHDALDDAVTQALHLQDIIKVMA